MCPGLAVQNASTFLSVTSVVSLHKFGAMRIPCALGCLFKSGSAVIFGASVVRLGKY